MNIYLVSYANARFVAAQAQLMASAVRFGVTDPRPWSEETFRRTMFYSQHKTILDLKRGAGYWLWKPFIISQTLTEMRQGDCLIYSDSGIEIIADLSPLLRVAFETRGLMVFRGYGRCREWTKRDCFLYMNADDPDYHEAQMLDASFIVLLNTPLTRVFVSEWLENCCDGRILTDEPNTCGLPNLPGFVDHRHDQSVLSLLAVREGLELFRRPSQFGNHLKMEEFRETGEPLRVPYTLEPYRNSPYGTLLDHHRGKPRVQVRRVIDATGQNTVTVRIPRSILLDKLRRRKIGSTDDPHDVTSR